MLSDAFLESLPEPMRGAFAGRSDLETALEALASARGDDLDVERAELVRAVAARIEESDLRDPFAALASFRARDLAIAIGSARGLRGALDAFEREHRGEIDRAIEKSRNLGFDVDEFRQIVREKLFVAKGDDPPKIASYGGRAPLSAWVRVTCARTVVDLVRRKDQHTTSADDDWLSSFPDTDDPELRLLRARYAPLLPTAFGEALRQLSPKQRNLLRQRFLHEISAQALATSLGVHRATVTTWIDDARRELLQHVRKALQTSVAATSLDSVVEVMGSALDVSIRRLLESRLEDESE